MNTQLQQPIYPKQQRWAVSEKHIHLHPVIVSFVTIVIVEVPEYFGAVSSILSWSVSSMLHI